MDVLAGDEGLDEGGLPGHVGQDPELYLRVIGDHELAAFRGREGVPDTGSELRADRDVLQVGGVTGYAARRCRCLVECGVDTAVLVDQLQEALDVGTLQLGKLPVGDDA